MSMAMQARISALEEAIKLLNSRVDGMQKPNGEIKPVNPNGPRNMCPKCGKVPAYHLHVKHCKGGA